MPYETYSQFRSRTMGGRFTDWLRDCSGEAWDRAVGHRFTVEIAGDTLDDRVYERYLIQDYAFVGALTGLVGFAVGHAPTMPQKGKLSEFLSVLTNEEDTFFLRSFAALGVPRSTWENAVRGPVTRDLAGVFDGAVADATYDSVLAALLPVEWVYLEWATRQAGRKPARHTFDEWITLHNGDGFREFVEWLRSELDRLAPSLSADRQGRLRALFSRAVELEVGFFDAAYEGR